MGGGVEGGGGVDAGGAVAATGWFGLDIMAQPVKTKTQNSRKTAADFTVVMDGNPCYQGRLLGEMLLVRVDAASEIYLDNAVYLRDELPIGT